VAAETARLEADFAIRLQTALTQAEATCDARLASAQAQWDTLLAEANARTAAAVLAGEDAVRAEKEQAAQEMAAERLRTASAVALAEAVNAVVQEAT
jgi:hypothetical protein